MTNKDQADRLRAIVENATPIDPSTEEPPIDKDLKITQLKWLLDIRDAEIIHLHSQMSKALTDKEEAVHAASEAKAMVAKLISRETVELLRADKARDEAFELASDKDGEIALLKSNLARAVAEIDQLREDMVHVREAERQRDCAFDRVGPLVAVRDKLAKERDEALKDAAFVRSVNTRILTENSALKASNAELMSGVDKALESEALAISRATDRANRQAEIIGALERERDVLQQLLLDLRKQTGWRQFKDQKPTMDDSDANGCVMMCGTDDALAITRVCAFHQLDEAWWRPTMSPVVFTPYHQWVKGLTPDERAGLNGGNLRAIWESIEKFNQNH